MTLKTTFRSLCFWLEVDQIWNDETTTKKHLNKPINGQHLTEIQTDLHDGAAVSLRVVDVEGDEVLALHAGAALVVDPHVFPLEAQLEELTLGDGNLHLSVLTVHLCLDDVIVAC